MWMSASSAGSYTKALLSYLFTRQGSYQSISLLTWGLTSAFMRFLNSFSAKLQGVLSCLLMSVRVRGSIHLVIVCILFWLAVKGVSGCLLWLAVCETELLSNCNCNYLLRSRKENANPIKFHKILEADCCRLSDLHGRVQRDQLQRRKSMYSEEASLLV